MTVKAVGRGPAYFFDDNGREERIPEHEFEEFSKEPSFQHGVKKDYPKVVQETQDEKSDVGNTRVVQITVTWQGYAIEWQSPPFSSGKPSGTGQSSSGHNGGMDHHGEGGNSGKGGGGGHEGYGGTGGN